MRRSLAALHASGTQAAPRPARTGPAVVRASWSSNGYGNGHGGEAKTATLARISAWRANGREPGSPASGRAGSWRADDARRPEDAAQARPAEPEPEPQQRQQQQPEPEAQEADGAPDVGGLLGGGLMNNQFAAALQAALGRGGEGALVDDLARGFSAPERES
jgi:hypothetical protein